jgi:hypothetical protein
MYNIFKRPMFKLGGMTQGTGIMSHVESRPQYFNGGRIGYANGPGPVLNPFTYYTPSVVPKAGFATTQSDENSGLNLLRQAQQKFDEEQKANQLANRQSLGITSPEIKRGYGFLESDPQKLLRERGLSTQLSAADRARIESGLKAAKQTEEKINLYGPSEDIATENIIVKGEEKPKVNPPKYTETKTSRFNLLDEVKRESAELKELLKDEDYSRGELALIVSAALGKKGTISEKIQEATKLALPVARARKEEDKAVTLAAYKLAKEKEQQQIKSGALPESLKILRAQAEKQAAATGRDTEEVYSQLLTQNIKLDPVTAESVQTLSSTPVYGEITKLVNNIKDAQRRKDDALETKKDTKAVDRELLELNSQLDTYKKSKGFELVYPQFMNFASGGRVMKAVGGDVEEEVEDNKLVASNVSFGSNNPQDATVVEKPVQKLSYGQLRDRLPKEITNDVVMLLSNSEEALQDFAYIRTQDDVGKFNVKYGVNLVVPPTAG